MEKRDWLAQNFEEARKHLKAVAYQMLGSSGEAEDAVQEVWIRLNKSNSEEIDNLRGWLTTVVARVCLDMLRARKSKREEPLEEHVSVLPNEKFGNPESEFMLADSIGPALFLVLELLTPVERIALVLHDIFDLSFDEIAPILDRSEESARQLASRARRKVRGARRPQDENEQQQEIVAAFISAARDGNLEALIRVLHPDVVLRADSTAVKIAEVNKGKGAPQFKAIMNGANTVAETFKGKAAAAQLAWINGVAGGTWAPGGKPVVAFSFKTSGGKITEIEIMMDRDQLEKTDIKLIE
jgi:RNA polymerase sigma-70 factor (ECF subfamily)